MRINKVLKQMIEGKGGTAPVGGRIDKYLECYGDCDTGGGSSGGATFEVNFPFDDSTDTTTCDKTFDEINAAFQSGAKITGSFSHGGMDWDLVCIGFYKDTGNGYGSFTFVGVYMPYDYMGMAFSHEFRLRFIGVCSDGAVTSHTFTFETGTSE